jgi:DNA-binding GntR family transcriptional regulator
MEETMPGYRSPYGYESQRYIPEPTLAQRVFEGICHEIATRQIRPGEYLSRRKVAQRYGVSYIPVLEAFIRLEQTGVLEGSVARMAQVRPLTLEKIRDDFLIREAFETQAIREACDKATPTDIKELYRLAEAVDKRINADRRQRPIAIEEGAGLHWAFHMRIAELSGSGALVRALERLALLRHFYDLWRAHKHPLVPDPPRAHSRLVDPIRDRDVAAAEAEMRAHIRRGMQNECHAFQLSEGSTEATDGRDNGTPDGIVPHRGKGVVDADGAELADG